jgi:hypothetical protein
MQKKIFKSCVFFKESTQEEVSQTGNKNTWISFIYYTKEVKDHAIKALIYFINGMVEEGFADRTNLLLFRGRWYQFFHNMSSLHKNRNIFRYSLAKRAQLQLKSVTKPHTDSTMVKTVTPKTHPHEATWPTYRYVIIGPGRDVACSKDRLKVRVCVSELCEHCAIHVTDPAIILIG